MASIWKGSISIGLVSIPVQLRTAVREDGIRFRLLHQEDLSPIRYERVCEAEGEAVPWNEVVKGYEYQKGKFVVLDKEDFDAAAVEADQTIDVLDFVAEDEIDPRFFERPYYLVPTKGGEKAYALLREAIRDRGSVGIGKIVMRQKQHLAAIRVHGEALLLELMRFAHELVDAEEYSFPTAELRPQEFSMAKQLVESLTDSFNPAKYTDDYRNNLMRIIKAKAKGKPIDLEPPQAAEADAQVIDLMARLRESLEQAQGKEKPARKSTRASKKKEPAASAKRPTRSRTRKTA